MSAYELSSYFFIRFPYMPLVLCANRFFFFKGAFMLSTNYDLTKESSASFRLMLSVIGKWLSSERNINVRIGDEMSVWRR